MKEILERFGFVYQGLCKVCDGQAELYKKGKHQCKVMPRKMKFELLVNGRKIRGSSGDLEMSLGKYIPA